MQRFLGINVTPLTDPLVSSRNLELNELDSKKFFEVFEKDIFEKEALKDHVSVVISKKANKGLTGSPLL